MSTNQTADRADTAPGPEPRALRFFGTSWATRSGPYWPLRIGFVLVTLVLAVAGGFVLRFALQGLSVGDGDRMLSVLGTVGVGICSAMAAARTWNRLDEDRKGRAVRASSADSASGAGRRNPQTPLMILGFVGWLLAHAVHGCVEAPGESAARRDLEKARLAAARKPKRRPKKKRK